MGVLSPTGRSFLLEEPDQNSNVPPHAPAGSGSRRDPGDGGLHPRRVGPVSVRPPARIAPGRRSQASIEQAVLRRFAESLRPELLARIPDKLVFARLAPDVLREIVGLHLANEVARLKSVGFDLEVSREALEFLIREGFHPQLGARPLRQTIERHLQDAVARGLFASGTGSGRIDVEPGSSRLGLVVS